MDSWFHKCFQNYKLSFWRARCIYSFHLFVWLLISNLNLKWRIQLSHLNNQTSNRGVVWVSLVWCCCSIVIGLSYSWWKLVKSLFYDLRSFIHCANSQIKQWSWPNSFVTLHIFQMSWRYRIDRAGFQWFCQEASKTMDCPSKRRCLMRCLLF